MRAPSDRSSSVRNVDGSNTADPSPTTRPPQHTRLSTQRSLDELSTTVIPSPTTRAQSSRVSRPRGIDEVLATENPLPKARPQSAPPSLGERSSEVCSMTVNRNTEERPRSSRLSSIRADDDCDFARSNRVWAGEVLAAQENRQKAAEVRISDDKWRTKPRRIARLFGYVWSGIKLVCCSRRANKEAAELEAYEISRREAGEIIRMEMGRWGTSSDDAGRRFPTPRRTVYRGHMGRRVGTGTLADDFRRVGAGMAPIGALA